MPRRSKKTNFEDEVIQEAEVITHWSFVRIIVAIIILIFVIGGGILGVNYFFKESKKVLGTQEIGDRPQIAIPNEKKVQTIIEKAKKDLAEIDPKNVIQSQPQIQKIISDLQNISGSSNSARRLICESLCQ